MSSEKYENFLIKEYNSHIISILCRDIRNCYGTEYDVKSRLNYIYDLLGEIDDEDSIYKLKKIENDVYGDGRWLRDCFCYYYEFYDYEELRNLKSLIIVYDRELYEDCNEKLIKMIDLLEDKDYY